MKKALILFAAIFAASFSNFAQTSESLINLSVCRPDTGSMAHYTINELINVMATNPERKREAWEAIKSYGDAMTDKIWNIENLYDAAPEMVQEIIAQYEKVDYRPTYRNRAPVLFYFASFHNEYEKQIMDYYVNRQQDNPSGLLWVIPYLREEYLQRAFHYLTLSGTNESLVYVMQIEDLIDYKDSAFTVICNREMSDQLWVRLLTRYPEYRNRLLAYRSVRGKGCLEFESAKSLLTDNDMDRDPISDGVVASIWLSIKDLDLDKNFLGRIAFNPELPQIVQREAWNKLKPWIDAENFVALTGELRIANTSDTTVIREAYTYFSDLDVVALAMSLFKDKGDTPAPIARHWRNWSIEKLRKDLVPYINGEIASK